MLWLKSGAPWEYFTTQLWLTSAPDAWDAVSMRNRCQEKNVGVKSVIKLRKNDNNNSYDNDNCNNNEAIIMIIKIITKVIMKIIIIQPTFKTNFYV